MKKNVNKSDLLFHKLKIRDNLEFFSDSYENPEYIKSNFKDKLRPYQEEALRCLHYTQVNGGKQATYNHLFFHMATGAGKTMVMAGAILYLFEEYGYQNFLFFVHTDAIIQKTKENLLNSLSSKHLFKHPITINNQKIFIEEVERFPDIPDKHTIYLKLSTIHKLHDDLSNYKENSINFEDLKEKSIVLLGDEAHHYNASTKSKTNAKEISWEKTVQKLVSLNPTNRLLEFSATIDLTKEEIYHKYKDKITYQYDLKQFMLDGYSKKVMLLEADQNDEDKMLDAVLLSQYRKLIAIKNNIEGFKPVILFKSNKIAISKNKYRDFIQLISALTPIKVETTLLRKKRQLVSPTSIWHKVIDHYLSNNLISIVNVIQEDFNEMNLLNVNKEDVLEEHPKKLNTLEDIDNPIRAVFAVAKLNEGWDVLNLYDIVRISESASTTKNATDSEAQLIGRGARYYPFSYNNEKSYTRRFDISTNELSILEQLYYHTVNEPSYIKTLHKSLEQADIILSLDGSSEVKEVKVKESFKASKVYQYGSLYFNRLKEIEGNERTWKSYSLDSTYTLTYNPSHETALDNLTEIDTIQKNEKLLKLDKRFYYKAIQKINFYRFDNLKIYFPDLTSIEEFITNNKYLGGVKINILIPESSSLDIIHPIEKLSFLEDVLNKVAVKIARNYRKSIGTYHFISKPVKEIVKDYSIQVDPSKVVNQKITAKSSIGKKWYVYDQAVLNQLEHKLIDLLQKFMDKLKGKYDEIYVIRNDEQTMRFKLTEFDGVRGFMPDFIMILTSSTNDTYCQVFLEPKGDDRIHDNENAWKEKMLESINHEDLIILDEENVRLIGIKFFADCQRRDFIKDFEDKVYDGNILEEASSLLF